MIVHVPYTNLPDQVRDAVVGACVQANNGTSWQYHRMAGTEDYYHLLSTLWGPTRRVLVTAYDGPVIFGRPYRTPHVQFIKSGFIINEHDIVPRPDSYRELQDCPEAWCGFAYPIMGLLHAFLGCTKFSTKLIERHPDLMQMVGEMSESDADEIPPKHWKRNDYRISEVLQPRGERIHVHWPPLLHMNAQYTPTHQCVNGGECQCVTPINLPHACPFFLPNHEPLTVMHYCREADLVRHLDIYDIDGRLVRMADQLTGVQP